MGNFFSAHFSFNECFIVKLKKGVGVWLSVVRISPIMTF